MDSFIKINALFIGLILLLAGGQSFAQQSKKLIAAGNQLYQAGKFKEASMLYSQALKSDTSNIGKSSFNLGNALYQQKQPEAARKAYETTATKSATKQENASANYNVGNTYMQERKWEDAIEAYKKTLRNNPQDADAKYNLSYAKAMLKKEGGGGGKNKDKNKDKKDQDKKDQDKKDQDKNNQDKKDQDKKGDKPQDNGEPKDDQKKDQEGQQPQPSKLSQQQADQLLNALQQEEKKLQDKNKKVRGTPVKVEKDW